MPILVRRHLYIETAPWWIATSLSFNHVAVGSKPTHGVLSFSSIMAVFIGYFSFICPYTSGLFPWEWSNPPDSKVHGANMRPPGSCRPQMGPMLAPWTLLSGPQFQWCKPERYRLNLSSAKSHKSQQSINCGSCDTWDKQMFGDMKT